MDHRFRRVAALLCAGVLLSACQVPEPTRDDRLARDLLRDLQTGRADAVAMRFDSSVVAQIGDPTAAVRAIGDTLATFGTADSAILVGWHVLDGSGGHSAQLTYEFSGKDRWALIGVELRGEGVMARMAGVHYQIAPRSLVTTNAFTLSGKPGSHYAILAAAVAMALVSLTSAVVVARTRPLRRRWLWAFLALLGTGTMQLNWTDGRTRFQLLRVQVLSASVTEQGPYAPWIVAFSAPLGALVALQRRRQALTLSVKTPQQLEATAPEALGTPAA